MTRRARLEGLLSLSLTLLGPAVVPAAERQGSVLASYSFDDDKPQVRQIALQALQILTGQTKGFQPMADPESRRRAVEEWKRWLVEYRANL